NIQFITLNVPAGDKHRNLRQIRQVCEKIVSENYDVRTIIALGNNTILNIAGFISRIWHSPVNLILIPATLLAQTSSVHDISARLNVGNIPNQLMIDTRPNLVWIDIGLLKSLNESDILSGIAAVLQYCAIDTHGFINVFQSYVQRILNMEMDAVEEFMTEYHGHRVRHFKKSGEGIYRLGSRIVQIIKQQSVASPLNDGKTQLLGIHIELCLARKSELLSEQDFEALMRILKQIPLEVSISDDEKKKLIQTLKEEHMLRHFYLLKTPGEFEHAEHLEENLIMDALNFTCQ
ncbi:hypothetical protein GF337_02685, partial [candidate division KSB1 bacterium]|nr:hypothetical protein [candidate division KSB1 bacterium]